MIPTAAPWAQTAKQQEVQAKHHPQGNTGPGSTDPVLSTNGTHIPPPSSSTPSANQQQQQQQQQQQHEQQQAQSSPGGERRYVPAHKALANASDLQLFLQSEACRDYIAFVLALNQAVTGRKLSEVGQNPSPAVQRMVATLDVLGSWVDEIPPEQQSLRYGNPAFRTWFARLTEQASSLLERVLLPEHHPAIVELTGYFIDSFGNATRIDYGTGHETTFCAFLHCLSKLGVFTEADHGCVVSLVFNKYLNLMRRIQTTYWLEPAGSHGVWGLDDYNFLPFIWGSAQLINHPLIRPKSIHNPDILEEFADEYLYLGCITFVKQVKKGPLQETSPMLCDISYVPHWAKVNSGMIKMYQAEVLSKFPIMQHFLFGSIIPFQRPSAPSAAASK
ncbi:hypothetical protein DUNSADRAFT_15770 [Dunaliella salina]|uniref:Serine/threonine-protein phosphatase 2A activator n=1 Tax=Dunaliella salina TaxID=3046 RepID=A0ABQ7H9E2_DUNSA|nr:hypothetical protein DUNSADRAFT_15770 [Dunaliella salina]|eukprot:KAF5843475.1 hypothetical protein DUNSADRAFT_15770 [Dunaliella salina]